MTPRLPARARRPAARPAPTARLWHLLHEGLEVAVAADLPGRRTFVPDRYAVLASAAAEQWWYRGLWHDAPAGTPRLLEPGEVVHVERGDAVTRVLVLLGDDRLGVPAAAVRGFHRAMAPTLAPLVQPVLHGAVRAERGAVARALPRLLEALQAHEVRSERGHGQPPAIQLSGVPRARALLRQETTRLVPLDELAAVAGLSRYHLTRRFAAEIGLPPHLFHLHVRIGAARRRLAAGEDAAATAHHTGFADQAHLSRWFTRLVGLAPGRYQQQLRHQP